MRLAAGEAEIPAQVDWSVLATGLAEFRKPADKSRHSHSRAVVKSRESASVMIVLRAGQVPTLWPGDDGLNV